MGMRDLVKSCSWLRIARLLRCKGFKAQRGYRKRPYPKAGAPAIVVPNLLEQPFTVQAPNLAQVNGISLSTDEGWQHLAVVIDLFSCQVAGWATGSRIDTQLAMAQSFAKRFRCGLSQLRQLHL